MKIIKHVRFLSFICIGLFLVACGDEGTSEPIQYPGQSAVEMLSSAESLSETVSSMAESSSSVENSSSETLSNSSSSFADDSSAGQSSSSIRMSSSSMKELFLSFGTMTDERDGQVYKTLTLEGEFVDCSFYNPTPFIVKLPKTTWMIENLRYAYLQPTSTLDSSSWNIDHDVKYAERYGRLYLWSAAVDSAAVFSEDAKGCGFFSSEQDWLTGSCLVTESALIDDAYEDERYIRGVCPEGWHLPTSNEEMDMIIWRYCQDWDDSFNYKNSLAGIYDVEKKVFSSFGTWLFFWTAAEKNQGLANVDALDRSIRSVSSLDYAIYQESKSNAVSVRCVKDIPDIE